MTKREKKRLEKKQDKKRYEADMAKFRRQLGGQYLKLKEIGGDGNCLFRAIADQFVGDEAFHKQYRRNAVAYIRENADLYVHFIEDDETIEEYCDDMAKDGTWGG